MGDVLSLIEKAQTEMDQTQAMAMGQKLLKGEFNLEDFLAQLQQIKKLGPLSQFPGPAPADKKAGAAEPVDGDDTRVR